MLSEEEKRAFLKNEEKLWDLAAITAAPTFYQTALEKANRLGYVIELRFLEREAAEEAYNLADALMAERVKRLKEEKKF